MPSSNTSNPPRTSSHSATILTSIGLLVFIIAFFPDPFAWLIRAPFRYLTGPSNPTSTPTSVLAASCLCTAPIAPTAAMSWHQTSFTLAPKTRGSYLIDSEVKKAVPEIKNYRVGLLHLFLQHTSAALSLNENFDSEVREDMSDALDRIAPEDRKGTMYKHDAEGLDDMPAHIKSSLMGASVSVPIRDGKLATGTWQGIWFLEFRTSKHTRKVVATVQGEKY